MWFLNWASAVYGDFQKITTEYPVFLVVWGFVAWLAGVIPRKWVLEKLRLIWPWDQVAMSDASAHLLGHIDGGLVSELVRRQKTAADMLAFLANYLANFAKVTAVMPPAKRRVSVNPEEFKRGVFLDEGNSFYYHHTEVPKFTSIAVTRWRLWFAIRGIKGAESNLSHK